MEPSLAWPLFVWGGEWGQWPGSLHSLADFAGETPVRETQQGQRGVVERTSEAYKPAFRSWFFFSDSDLVQVLHFLRGSGS